MFSMRALLILVILVSGISNAIGQNSFQVGFWNIENLFDTTNALGINDDDFTPAGRYAWTDQRLNKKFHDLAKVIHDINENNDLALLGLAEIENLTVLRRLNRDFIKQGFKIIHQESPDERGIDCGLLYDPQKLVLLETNFIPIFLAGNEKTRDIIEAKFSIPGSGKQKPLYVFINHWPSRWGGQEQTDPLRRSAASTLRIRIDEILTKDPKSDIVILGDFNDYPDDPSLRQVLRAGPFTPNPFPGDLINTTWKLHEDPHAGTMMYKGTWGVLDQIIISYGMMDRSRFKWNLNSSGTLQRDYLIEKEGKYAGWPYRMHRKGKYQGGYSDHLPILCGVSYTDN